VFGCKRACKAYKKEIFKNARRTTERKMRVSKTGQEQFGRKRSTGYNFVLLPAGGKWKIASEE
jgi:hypothetical protein